MSMKVKQGQIWLVNTNRFMSTGENNEFKRPIVLKKFELIEIRYPYAWHFRTLDDYYFHAKENSILKNCIFFGKINENVNFQNIAKLSEIINLCLFEKSKDGENQYCWAKNIKKDQLKEWGLGRLIERGIDS